MEADAHRLAGIFVERDYHLFPLFIAGTEPVPLGDGEEVGCFGILFGGDSHFQTAGRCVGGTHIEAEVIVLLVERHPRGYEPVVVTSGRGLHEGGVLAPGARRHGVVILHVPRRVHFPRVGDGDVLHGLAVGIAALYRGGGLSVEVEAGPGARVGGEGAVALEVVAEERKLAVPVEKHRVGAVVGVVPLHGIEGVWRLYVFLKGHVYGLVSVDENRLAHRLHPRHREGEGMASGIDVEAARAGGVERGLGRTVIYVETVAMQCV